MFEIDVVQVHLSDADSQLAAPSDIGAVPTHNQAVRCTAEAACRACDLPDHSFRIHSVSLEDVWGLDIAVELRQAALTGLLRNIRDGTARQDTLHGLRMLLLRHKAQQLGCNKLLLADCMDTAAAAFVSSLAKVTCPILAVTLCRVIEIRAAPASSRSHFKAAKVDHTVKACAASCRPALPARLLTCRLTCCRGTAMVHLPLFNSQTLVWAAGTAV
jgi:hypothetical protein